MVSESEPDNGKGGQNAHSSGCEGSSTRNGALWGTQNQQPDGKYRWADCCAESERNYFGQKLTHAMRVLTSD